MPPEAQRTPGQRQQASCCRCRAECQETSATAVRVAQRSAGRQASRRHVRCVQLRRGAACCTCDVGRGGGVWFLSTCGCCARRGMSEGLCAVRLCVPRRAGPVPCGSTSKTKTKDCKGEPTAAHAAIGPAPGSHLRRRRTLRFHRRRSARHILCQHAALCLGLWDSIGLQPHPTHGVQCYPCGVYAARPLWWSLAAHRLPGAAVSCQRFACARGPACACHL